MTAAYYDFFRKITLQPDGVTLEADSVSDTLTITGGNGVAFNPNVGADSFEIDVNYQLFVPIGSTKIRLNDINSNFTDITMTAGSNMSVGRNSANELVFTSTVGGTSKAVSGATQASPVVITTNTQHQFTEGIAVTITDIVGMTELNGNEYYMDILTSQTFALYTDSNLTTPLNGTGFTAYGSGGVAVAEYSAPQALSQLNDVDLVGTPPVNGTYLQYNGTSWQAGTTLAGDLTGSVFGDTTICIGDSAELYAEDGLEYFWYPTNVLSNADSNWTYAYPQQNTNFKVIIKYGNIYGCEDTFDVAVNVSPIPFVNAGLDFWMKYGEPITLNASTNASNFYWESTSWISCNTCLNPQINPYETTLYVLNVADSIGCLNSDTVEVKINGSIYVPNTFTPNGDGINDNFEIKGENIKSFELWIYNRWGEEIYRSLEMNDFWDGKYGGNKCKIDSYIWVIEFQDFNNNFKSINGHINLIE